MLWPAARRVVEHLPAAPTRSYVIAAIVALVGIAMSLLVWMRAQDERRSALTRELGALADETTAVIDRQLDRKVDALRDLSTYWQLHGLQREEAWQSECAMVLSHYPGIAWIAWVPRDSTQARFAARDTATRVDPAILNQARFQLGSPVGAILDRWESAYLLDVFLPVRSDDDSLAMLVGEIRLDSTWFMRQPTIGAQLSVTMRSEKDDSLVLRKLPDAAAPEWMRQRRAFATPAGSNVRVDLAPADEFVAQVTTPWPWYFLVAGMSLSLALGALLFQFLRLRDFSAALGRTNTDLDAQIGQLSNRDRELRDLNEALEQRVQQRTAELSEALREVETFSHSVSHDLRSPIGAIQNFTAVLHEDYGPRLDDEGRRLLHRVRAAAERAHQLLNALVEFAASGAPPEHARLVDMREAAEGAFAEAVAREGRANGVRFAVGDLPPAWADPAQVHRVLVNLLDNALKYSRPRGERAVTVGGSVDGTECVYWVRDNGPGFEPSRAPEIFEPFRRLHGPDVEGTGLGLAIVAKIVRRLGGRTWAESDGASGATFYFSLPKPGGTSDDATDRAGGR